MSRFFFRAWMSIFPWAAAITVPRAEAGPFFFGPQGILAQKKPVPPRVNGLAQWLKADSIRGLAPGDPVDAWLDNSGKGCHATQSDAVKQPLYQSARIHGLPALAFDGVNDYLVGCMGTWQHVFAVVYIDPSPAAHQYLWGDENVDTSVRRVNLGPDYSHSNGGDFAPSANYLINGQATATIANGVWHIVEAFSPAPRTFSSLIGCAYLASYCGQRNWRGDIAELIIYDSALPQADAQLVEGYLAHKYGLAGSLPGGHPYKAIVP